MRRADPPNPMKRKAYAHASPAEPSGAPAHGHM